MPTSSRARQSQGYTAERAPGSWWRSARAAVAVAVLAVGIAAAPAAADTKTWTGAEDALWSTPGNWAGGVPVAGDRLVFSATGTNKSNVNDLAAGTVFQDITFLGSGYTIDTIGGNAIGLSGGITNGLHPNCCLSNTIDADLALSAPQTFTGYAGTLTINGDVALGSHTLTLGWSNTTVINGVISGSGGVSAATDSAQSCCHAHRFTADNTYTGATSLVAQEGLEVNGQQPASAVSLSSNGRLSGTGRVGNVTAPAGHFIFIGPGPGSARFDNGAGRLTTGNLSLASSNRLRINLNGPVPGTSYDQLAVLGTVSLGGATLETVLDFVPLTGQTFTIVDNDDTDAIAGTFSGLAEGATFTINGSDFAISYQGGDGNNDVVLTCQAGAKTWTGADDALWSNPDNWLGGVPVAGDALLFPVSASNRSNTNDLTPGTVFTSITFLGGGYTLGGNAIGLSGGITNGTHPNNCCPSNTIDADLVLSAPQSFTGYAGTLTINGDVALGSHTLTLGYSNTTVINGVISGSGGVNVAVDSAQNCCRVHRFTADNTYAGTTSVVAHEGLEVNGQQPASAVSLSSSGRLSGGGRVGSVTGTAGHAVWIGPGPGRARFDNGAGRLTTGNLSLASSNRLRINLNGPVPGTSYDQLAVLGTVSLGGATLETVLGFGPLTGQTFTIIDNDGAADAVAGTFNGLAEGATFVLNGSTFAISYLGGDGNDVVLTCQSGAKTWTGAEDTQWSNPDNWQGGAPVSGDVLLFPVSASNRSNTNDLTPGTVFTSITFLGGGYTLGGNAIGLSGGITNGTHPNNCCLSNTIDADLALSAPQTFTGYAGTLTINGDVALGNHTLTLGWSNTTVINGVISGSGGVSAATDSAQNCCRVHRFTADNTYTGATSLVAQEGLEVNGQQPASAVSLSSNGRLSGTGRVGNVTAPAGHFIYIGPGPSGASFDNGAGRLTTGNLSLASSNRLRINLNGPVPGTSYDQLAVLGTVSLGTAILETTLSFTPAKGQIFIILENDGSDPITGTFNGLAEGDAFDIGPYPFEISYLGKSGTDNDVILKSLSGDPSNEAPVAVDDAYAAVAGQVLDVVAADGLLDNDSDPNGDDLSVITTNATSANGGSATIDADGSFRYTPPSGFTGTDTFTYVISDGNAGTDQATVTITVNNQAPTASGDSYQTKLETTLTVNAPGVLGNDSDADGHSLSAVLETDVSHGTLSLAADGSFTYTPAAGYFGPDSFTYRASDGFTQSAPATVNLTVSLPEADLRVTKTADPDPAVPGLTVTYTVVVTNDGPDAVLGAPVEDLFAAELTCEWTCVASSGSSCTAGPVSGDVADDVDLLSGGTATYTATCDIAADAGGTIDNTATVAPAGRVVDPDANNDFDSVTIALLELDFGDAPDASVDSAFAYPMTLADDGARHGIVTGAGALYLGTLIDANAEGLPSAAADGDDSELTPAEDDEDGVSFPALIVGTSAQVEVTATAAGLLDVWFDWNADGDWDDAGEQALADEPLVTGSNTVTVAVPAGATLGSTFARFRVSSDGGLGARGVAADGEVEDYQVTIAPQQTRSVGFQSAASPVGEGAARASITVVLTTSDGLSSGAQVTVDYQTADGTATSPADYSSTAGTLTFPSGTASGSTQTIDVDIVGDAIDEGDEDLDVQLSGATGGALGTSSHELTILDDDTAGVTVSPTSGLTTTEAGDTATFTVVLTSEPTGNVVIDVASSNTAEGTVSPSQLTFTGGVTGDWASPQTVTLTGVDDQVDDGDVAYTVTVAMNVAATADAVYDGIDPADVSATNEDDDSAGVTVDPTTGLTTTEASGTATFTVVLTSEPTGDVVIDVASSNTAEGTVSPAQLTFTGGATGDWATPQTVTLTGVDDQVDDGNVAYTVTVSTNVDATADADYDGIDPADVSATNEDDDSAGVTVDPTTGLTTTEASGTATFTVVLTSEPTGDVVIDVASSNTAEGTVSPAQLTFTGGATGDWATPQTVTLTGVDDQVDDDDVAYTVSVAMNTAATADAVYDGIDPADVSATNEDDDTAGVTVDPTSGLTTTEAGGTATFTVVLTSEPTGDVVIDVASSTTAEGTVSPAQLTFTGGATGDWATPQTVTLTGVDDAVADGDQAYTVTVSTNVDATADADYDGIDPADVSATNEDDDSAGVTVDPTTGLITTEAEGTATFTVVLTSEPTGDVVIDVASSNTAEGTASPAQLTFTGGVTGDWATPQTVTLTGVDDAVADGDQPYTVTVSTNVDATADADYDGIDPADVSATNEDDDSAGVTVDPTSGLTTTEAGDAATFTVVLTSEPSGDVVIDVASSNIAEGTVSPAHLTFTGGATGDWATPQTVTLTGVDDAVADGDQSYTVTVSTNVDATADADYDGIDPADVSATNEDDDSAGVVVDAGGGGGLTTTETGGTATISVALASEPSGDVVIDVASSDTSEGTVSPAQLTYTGGVAGNWATPQAVTVTGVDDPVADGDQPYSVTFTVNAVTADATYAAMAPESVELTNLDDAAEGTFYTVTPCRLLDSRQPLQGPAFASGVEHVLAVHGSCGIPATARDVSVNVTVTEATGAGHLQLYGTVQAPPATSVVNFVAGQVRAGNAIVALGDGSLVIRPVVSGNGSVHVIIDVNGYFE